MAKVSIPLYELPPEYGNADKAWQRPNRRESGDANENDLFAAVGKALSRWELAENHMARLFGVLVESTSQASARAFGTVVSSTGRREMLEKAAEVYFDSPRFRTHDAEISPFRRKHDSGVLKTLLKNYARAAERRNDIAHGIVTEILWREPRSHGHFLVPPDYNTRRTKLSQYRIYGEDGFGVDGNFRLIRSMTYLARAHYQYASVDLLAVIAKFEEFTLLVAHFVHNLRAIEEHGDQR